jgi:hypothetical protein
MKKFIQYFVIAFIAVMFVVTYVKTESLSLAFIVAGVLSLSYLFDNIFQITPFSGGKLDKKYNKEQYKKAKETFHKKTDDNPTLR